MRQLILFRHAKTEPFSESGSDETRSLTERGHDDAQLMSYEMKNLGIEPTLVLLSTARRTRETWNQLKTAYPDVPYKIDDMLYLADPEEIIAAIEKQPDTACVVVIGHNPGMHDLAMQLAENGGSRNDDAMTRLRIKFPTAGIAVFDAKEDDPFNVYNFELTEFLVPSSIRH